MAGIVKNAEKTFPKLSRQLEELACSFQHAELVILESESNDATLPLLMEYAHGSGRKARCSSTIKTAAWQNLTVIHQSQRFHLASTRIDKIVYYRQQLRLQLQLLHADLLALVDMDMQWMGLHSLNVSTLAVTRAMSPNVR